MKQLCPVCKTPQRYKTRRGAFKLHQRPTGKYVRVAAVKNRDIEPGLRSSFYSDDIAIEAYDREVLEWCDGIVSEATTEAVVA